VTLHRDLGAIFQEQNHRYIISISDAQLLTHLQRFSGSENSMATFSSQSRDRVTLSSDLEKCLICDFAQKIWRQGHDLRSRDQGQNGITEKGLMQAFK